MPVTFQTQLQLTKEYIQRTIGLVRPHKYFYHTLMLKNHNNEEELKSTSYGMFYLAGEVFNFNISLPHPESRTLCLETIFLLSKDKLIMKVRTANESYEIVKDTNVRFDFELPITEEFVFQESLLSDYPSYDLIAYLLDVMEVLKTKREKLVNQESIE